MKESTKFKIIMYGTMFLALPLIVYLDYIWIGKLSILGYTITCLFEMGIYFLGIQMGLNLAKKDEYWEENKHAIH